MKVERIIQPYQFNSIVRKYLEENSWTTRTIERIIENLKRRERERARRELLKCYEDYGKDWVKTHTNYWPYKLEEAGFEDFDAFVGWAESEKD